jgi:hypothetical protein
MRFMPLPVVAVLFAALISPPKSCAQSSTSSSSLTRKPTLTSTLSESVLNVEGDGRCHSERIAKTISVEVKGVDFAAPDAPTLKTYVVLTSEGVNTISGKKLIPIEVQELQQTIDGTNRTFVHRQTNNKCGCCRKVKLFQLAGFYVELVDSSNKVLASESTGLKRKEKELVEEFLGREI